MKRRLIRENVLCYFSTTSICTPTQTSKYLLLLGNLVRENAPICISNFLYLFKPILSLIYLSSFSYRPTLKHQRPQEEKQKQFAKIDASYKRGTKEVAIRLLY